MRIGDERVTTAELMATAYRNDLLAFHHEPLSKFSPKRPELVYLVVFKANVLEHLQKHRTAV